VAIATECYHISPGFLLVFTMATVEDAEQSIVRMGFRISSRKLPILKAGPIEDMTNKLGIAPPEMIFGDNIIKIEHIKSGWAIEFNSFDALDRVDKTGSNMLKVSYSRQWQENRLVLSQFEQF
jgi:TIP41-like family protein